MEKACAPVLNTGMFTENSRTFTTWLRLKRGGEVADKTVYPDSYVKDDWRKRPLATE